MEAYAPVVPRAAKSNLPVILAGLGTTFLALVGVYLSTADSSSFHIMGWYVDYVLPVGALIVGLVAASGYGIASWVSGVKITKALLWIVLGLQLVAYFGAEYIHFASLRLYQNNGTPVGFFAYYDYVARAFAWRQENGTVGQPLGLWGYFFRGLEVVGFCCGGVFVPLVLKQSAYCESCQIYMRTKDLGLIPASVPQKKIKKSDAAGQAAYKELQEGAFATGTAKLASLQQLAKEGKTPQLHLDVQALASGKKETAKLPQRIQMHLVSCRYCFTGYLKTTLLMGQGKKLTRREMGKTPVSRDFVRLAIQKT